MPLFGKKRAERRVQAAPPPPLPEEVQAEEFSLKLSYAAKTSDGVRIKPSPGAIGRLPAMLEGLVDGEIEVIEPLPVELGHAAPYIARVEAASEWLQYHRDRSPVARHALVVLESVDAIDLAYDTLAVALLDGETDTSGYPEYNAIVGGVAAHWDEATGDMIVRAVVGWGGKGVRGDTDRNAQRLLSGILKNVLADRHAQGVAGGAERPMPAAGAGGVVCAHCGFASAHERAFYCPKCGMRLLRG